MQVFVGGFRGRGWPIPAKGQSISKVQVTRRLRPKGQPDAGTATGAEAELSSSGDLDMDPDLAAVWLASEPEDGEQEMPSPVQYESVSL